MASIAGMAGVCPKTDSHFVDDARRSTSPTATINHQFIRIFDPASFDSRGIAR